MDWSSLWALPDQPQCRESQISRSSLLTSQAAGLEEVGRRMRVRRYSEGTSGTWQRSKAVGIANTEYALLRNQASLFEAVLPSEGLLRGCFVDMSITC